MKSAKCLDEPGQTLGGDFTSDYANFITVRVTPCYNTTERTKCATWEESMKFLNTKTLVLSVKSEKILYNSSDFQNPVKKVIGEDNVLADPFIFNFPRYEMYEFRIDTDEGLIGQSSSQKSHYEYTFLNDIISAFDDKGQMPTDFRDYILFEYSFFESPTIKTQIRSYLKLTDVLASLGGIFKCYLVVFNFLFHQVYQRIMYEQVITQLFNFEKVKKHNLKDKDRKNTISSQIKKLDEKEIATFKTPQDMNTEKNDDKSNKPLTTKKSVFSNNFILNKENDAISMASNNIISPSMMTKKLNTNVNKGASRTEKNMTSIVSAYFSKKKIENQRRIKKIFSLKDHLILSFFPFCDKCSHKLNKVNEHFIKLIEYMYNYIDVLQMMRQFHELERLKFVLFNKKQLAIFQNIGIPEDPFNKKNLERLNTFYDFQYDTKAQKRKAKEFFRKDKFGSESKVTLRLKKLYLN